MTRCSVLLVDDEQLILDLYSAALRASGFTVHQASDSVTARAICARARPDVICIDGRMIQGSDGNLARELIEGGSPVVVFTNDQALFDHPPADVSGRLIKVNTRPAELGDRLREILTRVPERLR